MCTAAMSHKQKTDCCVFVSSRLISSLHHNKGISSETSLHRRHILVRSLSSIGNDYNLGNK